MDRVEGYRLVDMAYVDEQLAPLLTCPSCHSSGTLFCARERETSAGLAHFLVWECVDCGHATDKVATSRPLPRKPEQKGPHPRQINAQLVTGAVHTGLGQQSSRLLTTVLDLPFVSNNMWANATRSVFPAMEAGGKASAAAALVEERVEALAAGVLPDANGETPMVISADARWPRRSRANNSLDGYMAAIGERTKKVVDYAFRTKVGTRKNWSRASKAMEPSMGVEIVERLNSEQNGVRVDGLCMDLDSTTRAHVRELCEQKDWPEPRTLHDLNHFVKCVKGELIKIKQSFPARKVFTAETQLRLANQFSLMIHQQRTKYKGVADLKASLLQVVDHAFNEHTNCGQWFKCPCCGTSRRVKSNYNKDGVWLDVRGGPALKAQLVALVNNIVAKHGAGLMHLADTQGNEAFNSLSTTVTPKSLCVAFGDAGPARQATTVVRYNDGLEAAVTDVLKRVGAKPSRTMVRGLRAADDVRARHAIKKKSRHGKRLRKRAQLTRKERTEAEAEEDDNAQYASGVAF